MPVVFIYLLIYYKIVNEVHDRQTYSKNNENSKSSTKVTQTTLDKTSSIRSRENHVGNDNTPSRTIMISNSTFVPYNETAQDAVNAVRRERHSSSLKRRNGTAKPNQLSTERMRRADNGFPFCCFCGGSVAEWLAGWTQAQNGPGSNRSRDAVG